MASPGEQAAELNVPPPEAFQRWMTPAELSTLIEAVRSQLWGVAFFKPQYKHIREAITALNVVELLTADCRVRLPDDDAGADFLTERVGREMRWQAVEVVDGANTRRGPRLTSPK